MRKSLLVFVIFLVSLVTIYVLNDNKEKILPVDNQNGDEIKEETPITNIFEGNFKQKTDYTASYLKLDGAKKTFSLGINLCEMIVDIKGSYEVNDKVITLKFKANQYTGFDGEDDTKYQLDIIDDNSLKFISTIGEGGMCGPFKNETYERTN